MEVAVIEFDYIKVQILRLISKGVLIATPEKLSAKFAFKIVKGDYGDFQEELYRLLMEFGQNLGKLQTIL